MKARYDEKIKKYDGFQQLTQYRIVLYVVSHLGVVARESRELLKTWKYNATDPQYLYDISTIPRWQLSNRNCYFLRRAKRKEKKEISHLLITVQIKARTQFRVITLA